MKTTLHFKYLAGFILVCLLCISALVESQTSYYFYAQFTDKNNSPYSLTNPSAYLSERAIERRMTFNIAIDSTDLPVNISYVSQIENLGIHVHNASKWMNGVTLIMTDSNKMSLVRILPFIKFVEYTGLLVGAPLAPKQRSKSQVMLDYGIADAQITQLKGKPLHNSGFLGQGIQIGVIDAGFTNVDTNPCFDSLRLQGRLLGTKDIINPNSNIFTEDAHGANCLSIMTGNLSGRFLGTAPKASFWLIRTEYGPTEYKVETDFWCSGAEFADSVGVDLITSSLGYYGFDDKKMSFNYADMNGKVSRASRAANIASKKGIVVLVAAGNEGSSPWHYIGSPADADGIIAVGAVTSTGVPSSFTSFGPSYDGRVKPEICATGTGTAFVDINGTPTNGNGTSYATPAMAGMMACLLQQYKSINQNPTVQTLLQSVFKTGNFFNNPTDQMGYGIPDFAVAEQNLITLNSINLVQGKSFILTVNSSPKTMIIKFINGNIPQNTSVKVYSMTGKMMINQTISDILTVIRTSNFTAGVYAVCISENGKTETRKIIIN